MSERASEAERGGEGAPPAPPKLGGTPARGRPLSCAGPDHPLDPHSLAPRLSRPLPHPPPLFPSLSPCRNLRPHRRRQDHLHGTRPVLYGQVVQDRGGARGRGHDGLDGAGAGAGHHDHVGGDDVRVGRAPHQHHRHPRPRRLHAGGGARPARAGRRGRAVRLCRGRRAPVRDRLAPGRQVRRPPHLLRQQDGPHGRRLPAHGGHDREEPGRDAGRVHAAHRRGGRV